MKRNRNGRYQSAGELKSLVYGPNNELYLARVHANLMNWLGDPKQSIDQMMEQIEGEANALEGEFTKGEPNEAIPKSAAHCPRRG